MNEEQLFVSPDPSRTYKGSNYGWCCSLPLWGHLSSPFLCLVIEHYTTTTTTTTISSKMWWWHYEKNGFLILRLWPELLLVAYLPSSSFIMFLYPSHTTYTCPISTDQDPHMLWLSWWWWWWRCLICVCKNISVLCVSVSVSEWVSECEGCEIECIE